MVIVNKQIRGKKWVTFLTPSLFYAARGLPKCVLKIFEIFGKLS
jgi:hypothetical protein